MLCGISKLIQLIDIMMSPVTLPFGCLTDCIILILNDY
jgi:hypothetical protein